MFLLISAELFPAQPSEITNSKLCVSPSPYTCSITQPLSVCFHCYPVSHTHFLLFSWLTCALSCSLFILWWGVWYKCEGVRYRELDNQHHFPLLCDNTHTQKQHVFWRDGRVNLVQILHNWHMLQVQAEVIYMEHAHLDTLEDSCGYASQTLLNGLEALLSRVNDGWRGDSLPPGMSLWNKRDRTF